MKKKPAKRHKVKPSKSKSNQNKSKSTRNNKDTKRSSPSDSNKSRYKKAASKEARGHQTSPVRKTRPGNGAAMSHKSEHIAIAERDPRTLLGQILVELGYITVYQLDEALHAQRTERAAEQSQNAVKHEQKPLGQIMLELGYCTPNQLIRAIQVQSDYRKAALQFGSW